MRRLVLAVTLLPLLFSTVAGAIFVNSVKGNGIILPISKVYIRNDGSIEPSTVPIHRIGDIYTFTGDILNSTIEVQRDSIIIDGAGFTLQGNGYYSGIYLKEKSNNITIRNMNILAFYTGVSTFSSANIIVTGNVIHALDGLDFSVNSSNNQFFGNTLICSHTGKGCGIWIWGSFNSIINNSISNFSSNIIIYDGNNNIVSKNYWSDYLTRYPNATEVGDSGIGDTPYVIDANNTDNYPFMAPFIVPPSPPPEPQLAAETFPTVLVATASAISVAVIGLGLFWHSLKRKNIE